VQEPFPESVVILGAAGGGRLMYWCLQAAYPGTRIVFVDDGMKEDVLVIAGHEMPILHEWRFDDVQKAGPDEFRYFLVSPTYTPVKKALVTKALAAGLLPAPTVIHPQAAFLGRPTITIGRGGLICPRALVHNDTVIGDYVTVASDAHVGHDCVVGDFVAINPGSMILGYVHLETGVSLGAGTIVRDHLTLVPWVRTGMHACVTKDVLEEGITLIGIPARPMVKEPPSEQEP
jgi:serine acetyltransferase